MCPCAAGHHPGTQPTLLGVPQCTWAPTAGAQPTLLDVPQCTRGPPQHGRSVAAPCTALSIAALVFEVQLLGQGPLEVLGTIWAVGGPAWEPAHPNPLPRGTWRTQLKPEAGVHELTRCSRSSRVWMSPSKRSRRSMCTPAGGFRERRPRQHPARPTCPGDPRTFHGHHGAIMQPGRCTWARLAAAMGW